MGVTGVAAAVRAGADGCPRSDVRRRAHPVCLFEGREVGELRYSFERWIAAMPFVNSDSYI